LFTFFRRYQLSICWGLIILVLTGIPGQMIPHVPSFLDLFAPDKLVHLFIFGIFTFTLLRGFLQEAGISFVHAGILALLISFALGGITEILQAYVFINRQGSIYDFIADGVGSILGYFICRKWKSLVTSRDANK
jgi:VanZ family protein